MVMALFSMIFNTCSSNKCSRKHGQMRILGRAFTGGIYKDWMKMKTQTKKSNLHPCGISHHGDLKEFLCICQWTLYLLGCLLITFANSLDPDHENVGAHLGPNCLTLWWYSWKNFSKRLILKKKISRRQKSMKNFPGGKVLNYHYLNCLPKCLLHYFCCIKVLILAKIYYFTDPKVVFTRQLVFLSFI